MVTHVRVCSDTCATHLAVCGPRTMTTSAGPKDSWDYTLIVDNPVYGSQVDYVITPGELIPLMECYHLRCLAH